jgi:hypothetical protein
MIKNDIANYFESGKHANECLIKSNGPLYVLKFTSYMIQIVTLLNFPLVSATTMKEEVRSTLFMLLVMI